MGLLLREGTIETIMKLAFALLALSSSAAVTQTSAPAPSPKPVTHKATGTAAAGAAKTASAIPKVVGLPKTLYALKYIDIKVGTGPLAEPRKFYTVNYTGWFPDGKKFDSSYDHTPAEPFVFPYGAQRVIIGWDTGFEGMHVGGKRRLFVPYQLAYGLTGRPPQMPPKSNLIFDVELLSFSDKPPAPKTPPAPPAPPPTDAKPQTPPADPAAASKPAGTPDGTERTTPPPTTNPAPSATPAEPGKPATPPPAAAPTEPAKPATPPTK